MAQSLIDQDDPVAMDFVHCAANLRMQNYRNLDGQNQRWHTP